MKELKDQLKDWKKTHPSAEASKPSPSKAKAAPKAAPPPSKSDDELFREAVAGVDRDVALKKFDATPPPAATPPTKEEEEALFEKFVGGVELKRR